eukprot:367642-Alexandrium_andersonii.AAC.1
MVLELACLFLLAWSDSSQDVDGALGVLQAAGLLPTGGGMSALQDRTLAESSRSSTEGGGEAAPRVPPPSTDGEDIFDEFVRTP